MDRRTRNTGRDKYGKRVTEQSFKQEYPPGQADRAGGGRYAQRSSTAGNRTGSRYGQVPTGDRVRGRYGQIQIGDRTGRGYAQAESYERVSYARSMDRRYGGKKRRRTGRKISPKIFLIVFLVLLLVCGGRYNHSLPEPEDISAKGDYSKPRFARQPKCSADRCGYGNCDRKQECADTDLSCFYGKNHDGADGDTGNPKSW